MGIEILDIEDQEIILKIQSDIDALNAHLDKMIEEKAIKEDGEKIEDSENKVKGNIEQMKRKGMAKDEWNESIKNERNDVEIFAYDYNAYDYEAMLDANKVELETDEFENDDNDQGLRRR